MECGPSKETEEPADCLAGQGRSRMEKMLTWWWCSSGLTVSSVVVHPGGADNAELVYAVYSILQKHQILHFIIYQSVMMDQGTKVRSGLK